MSTQSEAVILKRRDSIKDNDEVVDAITSEGEFIHIFCTGTKKPESKNSIALGEGSLSTLEYFKSFSNEKMSKLKTSKLIDYYNSNSASLNSLFYYLELITTNKIEGKKVFETLKQIIISKYNFTIEIEIILLSSIYSSVFKEPVLSKCIDCGTRNNIRSFSFEKGGIICDKHSRKEDIDMKGHQILKLAEIFNANKDTYSSLEIEAEDFFFFKNLIILYLVNMEGFYISDPQL